MRLVAAALLLAGSCCAQFKSTVQLVVAPTTVTDSKGNSVDGLTTADLILYDNNVPQQIQMDFAAYPIDLVVAVQTSANSDAVLDKLGASGILFSQLLAADAGETALISFSDDIKLRQDFTADPDPLTHALRRLRKDGADAHMLDAMHQALFMLDHRPPSRRRIILMIAERRDRSSATKLPEVMEQVERVNAAVYWLNYSPLLEPFTDRRPLTDLPPGGLLYGLGELVRLHKPDLSSLFTRTTGGHEINVLKKSGLEHAIALISEEIHRQYILTFQAKAGDSTTFHTIRVEVKNHPELRVKTREGYWPLP